MEYLVVLPPRMYKKQPFFRFFYALRQLTKRQISVIFVS